ncbi:MAG: single-strand binding protein [Streptosporangiaceae bacterium]|nr:single-strand binding protein [Streptosporangiaceae bacterium]
MSTQVTIVGNLGADPELRFTPSGVAVAKMSVGVSKRVRDDQTKEWKDGPTSWHDVTAWRLTAEHVAESLQKGMRVIVVGQLEQRSYDDAAGVKKYAWQINADAIGPDLVFATATVKRVSKSGQGAPGDEAWASASKTRPAAAPAGPDGGHVQEPPF